MVFETTWIARARPSHTTLPGWSSNHVKTNEWSAHEAPLLHTASMHGVPHMPQDSLRLHAPATLCRVDRCFQTHRTELWRSWRVTFSTSRPYQSFSQAAAASRTCAWSCWMASVWMTGAHLSALWRMGHVRKRGCRCVLPSCIAYMIFGVLAPTSPA
jgi:hypothetical protein